VRALWIDSGNDPDFVKIEREDIDTLYFDMFDSRITYAYLQALVDRGFNVGVYMASNWGQFLGKNGTEIAHIVADRVKAIVGKHRTNHFPKVQLDMEEHDPGKSIECLKAFRALKPFRYQDLSWTMEGFQGGWMSPQFVQDVISAHVRVAPQAYAGDMRPFAQDQVLRDLLDAGFPANVISLFYDAANLPIGWNGFAFIQGRLPA